MIRYSNQSNTMSFPMGKIPPSLPVATCLRLLFARSLTFVKFDSDCHCKNHHHESQFAVNLLCKAIRPITCVLEMTSFADLKCAVAITNTEGSIAVNDLKQATELGRQHLTNPLFKPTSKINVKDNYLSHTYLELQNRADRFLHSSSLYI